MTDKRLGIAGLAMLAVSTAAMLGMHRVRADLDLVSTPLSFYSHGPHAWLLAVSLIASGLAVLVIAAAISRQSASTIGIWALGASGVGMVLAGIVVADPWFPWERNLTPRGWVHAIVVGMAVIAFPIGAMLLSGSSLGRDDRLTRRILRAVAVAFIATLGVFGGMTLVYLGLGRSPGFLGLAERLLMTLAVAWLVVVAPLPKRLVGGRRIMD